MPPISSQLFTGHLAPRWLGWVWAGARADDTATQRRRLMQANLAAGMMIAIIVIFNGVYWASGNPALIRSGLAQLPFGAAAPLVWYLNSRRHLTAARLAMFALAMAGCGAVILFGQGTRVMAHSYYLLYAVMAACFFPIQEWRAASLLAVINMGIFVALQVHGWPADPSLDRLPPQFLGYLQLGLQSGCLLVVVAIVQMSELVAERNEFLLRRLAMTDLLTALPNRRAFTQALGNEAARAQRRMRPTSLAMLDLDHFKRINDSYGHPVGDQALRHVAEVLMSQARSDDLVARIGGEEFAVLMPETDAAQAVSAMERLRLAVMSHPLRTGTDETTVTASIGVATLAPGWNAVQAMRLVDRALYEAKGQGRNRVAQAQAD